MKPISSPLLAVVAACLAFTAVRADDAAVQELRAAQAALAKAKAWRRTTVITNLDTNKAQTVVAEFVQPDLFRLVLPELQCFTDGTNTRVRQQDGTVSDGDAKMVQLLKSSREKFSMAGLLDPIKEAHVVERKTFRDLPTTMIACTIETEGMAVKSKLWISDADHLPLKIENEVHGQTKDDTGAARPINQRSAGSFEYGPTIKIVLP